MNWFAVYTKAKAEDLVSRKLWDIGIETYIPKLRITKYIKKRYREITEPLFPCYLFARFSPQTHLWMVKYTRGVRRVVGDKEGKPWPVGEEIIDLIRSNEKDGYIRFGLDDATDGDVVEIIEGPLKGLKGIFKQRLSGKERVVILLNAIACQAKIVVNSASLRKI